MHYLPLYGIVSLIKGVVTGPDITDIQVVGDNIHYVGRVGGLTKAGVEIRTRIFNVLDLPPRMPRNLTATEAERGPVVKEYRVEWDVPKLWKGLRQSRL